MTGQLNAEQLLKQSDDLQAFILKKFQPKKVFTKYLLEGVQGKRQLKLEADLFLETENGGVVLAFAPFAEGMKKWKPLVQQLSPALAWWQVAHAPKCASWVIFPMEGQAVEIRF